MGMIESAISYAADMHSGQVDKSGIPYIFHPLRVAESVRNKGGDDAMVCAAVLHDVVEDTDATFDNIYTRFGSDVSTMVEWLTRGGEEESYKAYIDCVATFAPYGAVLAKLCDVEDNLARAKFGTSVSLKERYQRARDVLMERIRRERGIAGWW